MVVMNVSAVWANTITATLGTGYDCSSSATTGVPEYVAIGSTVANDTTAYDTWWVYSGSETLDSNSYLTATGYSSSLSAATATLKFGGTLTEKNSPRTIGSTYGSTDTMYTYSTTFYDSTGVLTLTTTKTNQIILIDWYSDGSSKTIKAADSDGESATTAGSSNKYSYQTKITVADAGAYTLTFSDKAKMYIAAIAVYGETATDDYTLSGSITGDYTSGNLTVKDTAKTNYTAIVADGKYTFTVSVDKGEDAPYSTDSTSYDTFTVTAPDGYTFDGTNTTATVSVTAYDSDSKTYTLSSISLTKDPVVTISGTVTATDNIDLPSSAVVTLTIGENETTASISSGAFTFENVEANQGTATVSISGVDADYYDTSSKTINIGTENITVSLTSTFKVSGGTVVSNEANSPNAKYTFTNYTSGNLLIDPTKSASTPYYYTDGGYSSNNVAKFDSTGLCLYDNDSKDTLYVNAPLPSTVSSGTVTIEAVLNMPTGSGSWTIMSLHSTGGQIAALRANGDKYLVGILGTSTSSAESVTTNEAGDSLSAYNKDNDHTIKMVIDYDNNSVATYVDSTLINTVSAAENSSLSGLSYVTFRTAGGTRTLYVKSLSVTTEGVTNVITVDGTTYLIAGLTLGNDVDISDYDYVYLVDGNDNAITNNTEDSNGDTIVYEGVQINGTTYSAGYFNYDYVYGFTLDSDVSSETVEGYHLMPGTTTE